MYAANGTGIVLAEKGHFDVSKDLFTQVSTFLLIFCLLQYLGMTKVLASI